MGKYALVENEDGSWRLLEQNPQTGKYRRLATDLEDDDVAEEIFQMLEEDTLEAESLLLRQHEDGSKSHVRAIDLVNAEQRRSLGYVIATQPQPSRPGDPSGRRPI
jgi:hypothetical protein